MVSGVAGASARDIRGVPKIRNAELVSIANARIRLAGVDVPSLQQLCLDARGARWTCGQAARKALVHHAGKRAWDCHIARVDRHGRFLAACKADGEDVQQWLVRNGWAMAAGPRGRAYAADQKAARRAKAGLWHGAFIAPADWRVRRRHAPILGAVRPKQNVRRVLLASASGPVPPSPGCRIKGNVNRSGQCIFHRPTGRWYAQIRMKVSKGTRWFCSAQEAIAAGCRETRR
ncbi:MAG: thermonuclease family protein [Xanthobacteraceae bacterium]|nr:thermonuclease family protein [Xanthobacteraceae bacterium]